MQNIRQNTVLFSLLSWAQGQKYKEPNQNPESNPTNDFFPRCDVDEN